MFPTRVGLQFLGRIHEQIGENTLFGENYLRPSVRIRIHHDGYLPEVVDSKQKKQRNMMMLSKMVEEQPDDPSVWLYYGRETLLSGEVELGIERLWKALELGRNYENFARQPDILSWLIQAYLTINQIQKAEEVCQEFVKLEPEFPDGWYYLAYIQMLLIKDTMISAQNNLEKYDQATLHYHGLVSQDSLITDWKSGVLKADLARFSGNMVAAQSMYLDVIRRHPEIQEVRDQLEMIEQQRISLRTVLFPASPTTV
jgi:tetratricopeptide (TPR) repeat protein